VEAYINDAKYKKTETALYYTDEEVPFLELNEISPHFTPL
jgi:hypothetical protein